MYKPFDPVMERSGVKTRFSEQAMVPVEAYISMVIGSSSEEDSETDDQSYIPPEVYALSCNVYISHMMHMVVGERSRNSKFSYVSPRSIYGETSNKGKESASTYPCRSLSGSVQENGVEGVVLIAIQITGDPSAERMTPPRSTHVQPGDVSSLLIQQGERRS